MFFLERITKMKNLQNGRSMIEMLGVLAIIGVLSIGGLAGYTMAMNRHKANVLLDDAMKCGTIAQTTHEDTAFNAVACSNGSLLGASAAYASYGTVTVTRAALADGVQADTTVTITPTADGVRDAIRSRTGVTAGNSFTYNMDTRQWTS
ncbi:MAG: hypothetical protein ACI4RJ_04850 [Alphaproteobacteria bacterium]